MRCLALATLTAALQCAPLAAQVAPRAQFGGAIGYSLVGGGDSRTVVGSGVTGAGRAGLHLRAFVALPLTARAFTFQGELFYNRLTSGSNTYAIVGSISARSALVDQTLGLTGSFVASTSPSARVAPYFALGAGLFTSSLGSNPDPFGTRVTHTDHGMGLGLAAGGGVRWRIGRSTLLLDWRYYQALHNTRGSSFMPLSIGIAF
jgi:hypothetical protein